MGKNNNNNNSSKISIISKKRKYTFISKKKEKVNEKEAVPQVEYIQLYERRSLKPSPADWHGTQSHRRGSAPPPCRHRGTSLAKVLTLSCPVSLLIPQVLSQSSSC